MTKKFMALMLVFAMCLSLVACKDSSDTTDDVESTRESGITILPVEGLSEDFTMGVDISTLIAEENSGVVYYDIDGNEADLMQILKDAGSTANGAWVVMDDVNFYYCYE